MHGRTIILVSHHVQLCAPGAKFIVALENGQVQFQGDIDAFETSGVKDGLVQSETNVKEEKEDDAPAIIEDVVPSPSESSNDGTELPSETSSTVATSVASDSKPKMKKPPRKLVEEETRAVGRISKTIWKTYILAAGGLWYWIAFATIMILGALSPVAENMWLESVSTLIYIVMYSCQILGTGQVPRRKERGQRARNTILVSMLS